MYPEDNTLQVHQQHGESLKTKIQAVCLFMVYLKQNSGHWLGLYELCKPQTWNSQVEE
jgi:hypothetical protein